MKEEDSPTFAPSRLGTKEYWDEVYQKELQTFSDFGGVGEIWFGEESMSRVIRWLEEQNLPRSTAVLDIGTGNGIFLLELAKYGFKNLTGIDYSASSVELARTILKKDGFTDVKVEEMDFLDPQSTLGTFDLCIDKGTFDAISLNPVDTQQGKRQYVSSLRRILRPEGFFAITSCNWTKDELFQHFHQGFDVEMELPTPVFQFGGVTGNSVTSLVFKRRP
ncbi:EEF1A lysine methyltransferase 2 [Denticeps clupeoides]|uniref:EEF1A lysine methyltransferase 2 n=1 Tax=Denticeps clupeoides TaxID=299321 RepID=A0AAY4BRA8_9TELE|nr:EEF1A lysine methyltransferase 2 [Denticeps clupeoides]